MDCLNKKCSIKNLDERMLSCWLCHGLIHFKCSGIPTLAAEATQKHDGLHWRCNNCKKVGVDFYKFFQERKSIFLGIQKEMSNLSQRISEYGNLFDRFISLETYEFPPQIPSQQSSLQQYSPSQLSPRRKSARIASKTDTVNINPVNAGNAVDNHMDVVPSTSKITENNTAEKLSFSDVTKLYNPITNNTENAPRELRVIPPKKHVFVSRFAAETTVDDLNYYIKTKLNSNDEILTHKFSYSQPRSITSFKITVSSDIFNKIIDPRFWPDNTLVREYISKPRQSINNIARIPSIVSPNQKN